MATFETKFTCGDTVVWTRDPTNKMVVVGVHIDAHQIQCLCRPIGQQFASSYFFEDELQVIE